ncbi:MAG: sigma-54-dependent Fis family transcriptional regulator [Deferribacteres bacterium]|nr:sigma-54-dependent Fis family transcriptional regulator [candidate division KSB1 bacterium]MCB9502205.1 sigma-54-dependent Fis family transcriptional regulator [Deferribacteres bacterium]
MHNHRLLVVDDEKNIRRSIKMICTSEGYTVDVAEDGNVAMQILAEKNIALVLLDINLPGDDGLEILSQIKSKYPQVVVIMITGFATIQNAVEATKRGAYDFFEKPVSKEKLLITIKNALRNLRLEHENRQLKSDMLGETEMVGQSKLAKSITAQIMKVAPTDGRVLILGESGTGKELIARAIHKNSRRKDKPFVKLNCAAIPEELIESELFGSVKGAYTGATETRQGKFSAADGGTLFLDEIGDMSLKVQAKVLRVLQEGEFEKVGGQQTEKVDVRILAATNKDLQEEVNRGRFRDDLYFRLNVVPIVSAPLRERPEDIPELIAHFLQQFCAEHGTPIKTVDPQPMEILQKYPWPGNIRELKNTIERLVIMTAGNTITTDDLPDQLQGKFTVDESSFYSNPTLKEVRDQTERDYIVFTLDKFDWNISQCARVLGIDRTNLHKKMNALGIGKK